MRLASTFLYEEFHRSVGKFVRENHVNMEQHWMYGKRIIKNGLK